MNRSDDARGCGGVPRNVSVVRRVFTVALLLSVVHYIDNTVRFDDYTGGKSGFVTQAMIPIS